MKKIIIVLLIIFPLTASAEFIKWVDENGVAHYADNYADVPEKYLETLDANHGGKHRSQQGGTTSGPVEVSPFIFQGKIVDTDNFLHASLSDDNGQPPKNIDQEGRKLIFVAVWSNDTQIQAVHPDENLGFEMFSDKLITHLTIEVSGCGFFYRKNGPWRQNAAITVDLGGKLFVIDGSVKNRDGTPAGRVLVSAFDDANTQISYCYTNSRGRFAFYINKPVDELRFSAERIQLKKSGPWQDDATVDINLDQ